MTERKQNHRRPFLNMRRNTDISVLIFAYCAFGLILGFAQIAFSNEICATTYSGMERSDSPLLKKAAPQMRGIAMTNTSATSHIRFGHGNRLEFAVLSTDKNGVLQMKEGTFEVCDDGGVIKVASFLTSFRAKVEVRDSCFHVIGAQGEAAEKANPGSANFCPGPVPTKIQAAINNDENGRRVGVKSPDITGFVRQ